MQQILTTKQLVKDAALCAIVSVILFLLNSFRLISLDLIAFIASAIIAVYFNNKKLVRAILSAFVIFVVGFIYFDAVNNLLFLLPNCILGVVSKYFINIKPLIAFISGSIIYFIAYMLETIIYSNLILGIDFYKYITTNEDMLGLEFSKLNGNAIVMILFILMVIVLSIIKVSFIIKATKVYNNRISGIIDKE